MVNIEVNNRKIEARQGEYILSVLKRIGINIPTLCHIEGLPPTGACRMCVVEIEGIPGLVPSCSYPVAEGMKIKTHSPKVVQARKVIVELLQANHPDDCLYCSRNENCELQKLSKQHGITERQFLGDKNDYKIDNSSPSIVRDPAKCILCGRCIRVCEEIQGVACIDFSNRGSKTIITTAFAEGMNISSCVNCGQCILACPTGALREQRYIEEVLAAIDDPEKHVVVQIAPAVSVTIGEEFGMKPGADVNGIMTSALLTLGFDRVFETSFSADLTIMEEANELVERIKSGNNLPMITSCSPGWIKFAEQYYPDFIPNLSSCKSPQQMLGAVVKSYWAEQHNIAPENIFSVSIMPCTAKKFEAGRPEMLRNGIADVDAVLTTRELAKMIELRGIDLNNLIPEFADTPFGERSTAGKLFGVTGGVMEAALRTAHFILTGKEIESNAIQEIRGLEGSKEVKINIDGSTFGFAVVNGLSNAKKLLDQIKNGRNDIHFIEVMACPGGCIGGGGQPQGADMEAIKARMKTLYNIDKNEAVRVSHKNKSLQKLYEEFLEKPLSHKSHELLHTHYAQREVLI